MDGKLVEASHVDFPSFRVWVFSERVEVEASEVHDYIDVDVDVIAQSVLI
jgi:hypothetical protein